MSGGYFSVGNWLGEDKTATAFFEVLEALEEDVVTAEERSRWDVEFSAPLRAQLDELDEDDPPYMNLSREVLEVLLPPARRYFTRLQERLGHPHADRWPEIGAGSRGGEGWQLMCLADLFNAYAAACEQNEPVTIHFD